MVQLSPAKRLSAADYLARWQDSLFPQSFETFLRPFMRSLQVGWYCMVLSLCLLHHNCNASRLSSRLSSEHGSDVNGAEVQTGCCSCLLSRFQGTPEWRPRPASEISPSRHLQATSEYMADDWTALDQQPELSNAAKARCHCVAAGVRC